MESERAEERSDELVLRASVVLVLVLLFLLCSPSPLEGGGPFVVGSVGASRGGVGGLAGGGSEEEVSASVLVVVGVSEVVERPVSSLGVEEPPLEVVSGGEGSEAGRGLPKPLPKPERFPVEARAVAKGLLLEKLAKPLVPNAEDGAAGVDLSLSLSSLSSEDSSVVDGAGGGLPKPNPEELEPAFATAILKGFDPELNVAKPLDSNAVVVALEVAAVVVAVCGAVVLLLVVFCLAIVLKPPPVSNILLKAEVLGGEEGAVAVGVGTAGGLVALFLGAAGSTTAPSDFVFSSSLGGSVSGEGAS